MAYYCTRCELSETSYQHRGTAQEDENSDVLFCHACVSNTIHVPTDEPQGDA